jgi:hypothetical protein
MRPMTRFVALPLLALSMTGGVARAQTTIPPYLPPYTCQTGASPFLDWVRKDPVNRAVSFTLVTMEESDPEPPHIVSYVQGELLLDAGGWLSGGGQQFFNVPLGYGPRPFGSPSTGRLDLFIDPAWPDRGAMVSAGGGWVPFHTIRTACYDGALLFGVTETSPQRKIILGLHQRVRHG